MDKNAIKKFAIWARTELISRVAQRALKYGIEEGKDIDKRMTSFHDYVFSNTEKSQRNKLISKIEEQGYQNVIEEIAYTWFNRFCAIRFMEVNGYLPSHVRVFSDDDNNFDPQIIHEAINLDFVNAEKVYELREANKNEELYRYLLISQCNELSKILPGMFQKISDYTELLLPDYLLRDESVLKAMVEQIPQDDWKEQVQILGWMYQYYTTELNELVYDGTLSKAKIPKELISAATTIYTPDWSVRYMVENSLGLLWAKSYGIPENADWKYMLNIPEPDGNKELKPEDIKCLDPCAGSGHILCYMFDVLISIYESYGYSAREAASLILENNLYGLDIDDRAAQFAYITLMMKAREYDRRFFSHPVQPHVYGIKESNNLDSNAIAEFVNGDLGLKSVMDSLTSEMKDAKIYGSLTKVIPFDYNLLYKRFSELENTPTLFDMGSLYEFVRCAEVLSKKYHVCCTNPPYLGSNRFTSVLLDYVNSKFACEKADLSMAIFRKSIDDFTEICGYTAFITTSSWFYNSSFEKLREYIVINYQIDTIVDYGTELFEGKVGHNPIVSWVINKGKPKKDLYAVRLVDFCFSKRDEKQTQYFNINNRYTINQNKLLDIPGIPFAYWISNKIFTAFSDAPKVSNFSEVKVGLQTGNNDLFLRMWYEVELCRITWKSDNGEGVKWVPHNKAGQFRKWYGNRDYIVDWENNGNKIKGYSGAYPRNTQFYFHSGLSWSDVSSGQLSIRYYDDGFIFDTCAPTIFPKTNSNYLFGLLNSVVGQEIMKLLSPTIHYTAGSMAKIPVWLSERNTDTIVSNNIYLCKVDWDSFETSWDFIKHPFINEEKTILKSFEKWSSDCDERFNTLKSNEEELNRIFIDIYGLQEELSPEVEDKDVTVRKADLTRDIKSFISYAIGCLFGRYSLDVDGLAYAGGDWDSSKYKSIIPDSDNIIPICDDEYFEDDLTGLFIDFVKVVYGEDTLEENLKFIADTLGGKGTPREIIRKYFLNDFFADHCKTYQKRPIYWLFDSGKKNGFKCLIYMHRYQKDTIAKIRTDYVHEQQARYRTEIESLETRMDSASASESVKLKKKLQAMKDQAEEILAFEEKVHHLADQMIEIDLDDGVKNNYEIFKDVLAKIK